MIDERRLIQAIDGHTKDIETLKCLLVGLLKHIKQSQGEDSAHEAISYAIEQASQMVPMGRIGGSSEIIRDLARRV